MTNMIGICLMTNKKGDLSVNLNQLKFWFLRYQQTKTLKAFAKLLINKKNQISTHCIGIVMKTVYIADLCKAILSSIFLKT